jgi:hypothetical protein
MTLLYVVISVKACVLSEFEANLRQFQLFVYIRFGSWKFYHQVVILLPVITGFTPQHVRDCCAYHCHFCVPEFEVLLEEVS